MTGDQLNPSLNQLVRRQLRDLHINPDEVPHAPRNLPSRVNTWCGEHKQTALITVVGSLSLLLIIGALVVTSGTAQTHRTVQTAVQSTSTSVSLDDLTIQMTAPAYQRFSNGQAVLIVHLDLHNTSSTQRTLLANDVMLVDGRGGLFPPSWHDQDGTPRDGFADPNHTLLGLDPGAEARIDLPFLVIGGGPFTVRYQRQGEHPASELPALTLRLVE